MRIVILFVCFCAMVMSANAQVLNENFETAPVGGDLEGYNGWAVSTVATEAAGASPKIKAGALSYPGYKGSEVGNSVELLKSVTGRSSVRSTGLTIPSAGGSIYAAFLVNVSAVQGSNFREFISFDQSKENSYYRGRVFVKYDAAAKKVIFAVVKGATKPEVISAGTTDKLELSLDAGETHLLVIKYTAVDGNNNDEVSLFVNPDFSKAEDKQKNVINAADNNETGDYGKGREMKIAVRQRNLDAQVSGLIVTGSWSDFVGSDKKKKK